MGDSVDFRLLGPVEAMRNRASLALGGRRQRALLALLLLERGRPVSSNRLVEELWQGHPPPGAATTLRSYVSRLRTVLGADAPVTAGPAGYALEVAVDRVDSHRFERLAREGEEALAGRRAQRARERFAAALELWRGRPFAGLADDGALRTEAERLEELRLLVCEGRIEADLALGGAAEVVDELETLIREHPYRERLWQQLMLALYRAGRQADALAAYRRAREILDEELGLEPSEELKRLEQVILRQEVPAVAPPEERHNLPAPVTSFVGREAELAEVERLLATNRLVTLTGVGGVGKTRLALEGAGRALPDFADGVVFVDFAPLADPALVVRHVSGALDVEQSDRTVGEQLTSRLRDVDLLLVLDNCEHLREACAELAQSLLAACSGLRILATSRELLGIAGEVDYPVPPLTLPSPDADPDELRASEAVRLFLARAREARPLLADETSALVTAGRICCDLDGLPLALELAAARAKALSLEEIGTRLADRFRFLVSWRRLTIARHQTLEEAMDWSYELLPRDEQELLARLSVFAGGFTLDAAANVCLDGDDGRAIDLLGRLVDASLVIAEEHDAHMRYRLLETVREYALQRLDEHVSASVGVDADEPSLQHRHAAYYLELAEQRSQDVEQRGLLTPFASLDLDHANLRRALLRFREAGLTRHELRLCAALWRFWWLRGHIAEGREHLVAALEHSEGDRSLARARALRGAAALAQRQGDYEAAAALGQASADLAAELHDPVALAQALMATGNAVGSLGEFDRAERLYRASADTFRGTDADWDFATLLMNMGDLALSRGDLGTAEEVATESLALFRTSGNDAGIAANLGNLAFVALERGEPDRAFAFLVEALERSYALGFGEWVATMLGGLAAVAAAQGAVGRAAELLGASARLRANLEVSVDIFEEGLDARTTATVRTLLDHDTFEAALASGQALSTADAVALALSPESGKAQAPIRQ
jgi:predicted ATPase/DNA-binding SARP family transcriptional activator